MVRNMSNFEIGYTPNNLKMIREQFSLTQSQVAELTETRGKQSVSRWELDTNDKLHADMPLKKWEILLKTLDMSIDK